MKIKGIIFLALLAGLLSCNPKEKTKDDKYPYQNPELSIDERVTDLVSRMTLEEKISQMTYESKAVERLGVPEYNWWNECLHGVARAGLATVYPQAVGMAAMWDKEQMFKIATAISDEARAKHHDFAKKNKRGIYEGLTFWTPNINIFRDPRWGRGMETYGEDPYLTGSLAVNFIKGLQGNDPNYLKLVATAKHFAVHSGPEPLRHEFDAKTSEIDFWETYMPAFEMTVKEADVYSIMCAYNSYKEEPCCGSTELSDILRKKWDFKGYIVSDCWAIKDFWDGHNVSENEAAASARAVKAGTDLNCGDAYPFLLDAVKQGLIKEEEIDVSLKRLLKARFKLGMLDPEDKVPFAKIPYSVVDSKENQALALETTQKSMVLLKNEKNTLPLSKEIKKIAVIGPNANDVEVLLANYNGIPSNPVTPLQGIKNKLPDAEVMYSLGCEHANRLPILEAIPENVLFTDQTMKTPGLNAEYFANSKFEGEPAHKQIDKNVDFYWWDKAPFEDLNDDDFSVRWTGVIVPPESGEYAIGTQGFYGYKLFFEDSLLIDYKNIHHALKKYEYVKLEKGKAYNLKIDYYDTHGDAEMRLLWDTPNDNFRKEALEIAKKAEVVVMCMGLSPRLEGEEMKVKVDGFDGGDRLDIKLPEIQVELMKEIKKLGKPIVLVLLNGSAVAINWANANIPAIVEAWYPGQAGGTAIADVLFGDYNPAGRLPLTFYKSVDDLPPFDDYFMKGKTYRFFEKEPLYPFGYGLSYTTFEYKNLTLDNESIKNGENVKLTVEISNTGNMDGEEVVQLYVKDLEASTPRPIKALKAYERVLIKKGETKTITFEVTPKMLELWSIDQQKYIVEPGNFELMVGKSSADKDLQKVKLTVQ